MAISVVRLLSFLTLTVFLHVNLASSRRVTLAKSQVVQRDARIGRLSRRQDEGGTPPENIDICGQLVAQYNDTGIATFAARDAYDCLKIVPFNADLARPFLRYVRDTLEFQSSLAYLRDPPTSYQQPGIDVLAAIDAIEDNIDNGMYVNEYSFEADVQRVTYRMHDTHVSIYAGILDVFVFGSPIDVVSMSVDGIQTPKLYLKDDVIGNDGGFAPSAISNINGQDAVAYLTRYAKVNAYGYVEPHADWNSLFYNPVLDVVGYPTVFNSSTLYTGDLLNIQLENGTTLSELEFQASASVITDISGIYNAQDVYNTFVSLPADYYNSTSDDTGDDSSEASATDSVNSSATGDASSPSDDALSDDEDESSDATDPAVNNWNYISDIASYPPPDVAQPNLGFGGWVSGYFLNNTATGVLSIPSFQLSSEASFTFSSTIGEFLQRAQQTGMKRIVIDLQQNFGGELSLAFDAFKHFFPTTTAFAGSRMRAFDKTDILGTTLTNFFESYVQHPSSWAHQDLVQMIDDPWAVLNLINTATGTNFSSWGEFYGPIQDHGDTFTVTSEFDFGNPLFNDAAEGDSDSDDSDDESNDNSSAPFIPFGYANRTSNPPAPFAAEDIVVLTDTGCSSTCAVFVELMHHIAGVKSVVVGGLPQPGPAQTVGGSRGAQLYTDYGISANIDLAYDVNLTTADFLPEDRDYLNFTVDQVSFNLRDQVRQNENFPLQFAYDAADCRIFWTMTSLNNFTDLWSRAAAATWDDPDLCVADSTGYASVITNTNGPDSASIKAWQSGQTIVQAQANTTNVSDDNGAALNESSSLASYVLDGLDMGVEDDIRRIRRPGSGQSDHATKDETCGPNTCTSVARTQCIKRVICKDLTCTPDATVRCIQGCSNGKHSSGCSNAGGESCNESGGYCPKGSKCAASNDALFQAFCAPSADSCSSQALTAASRQIAKAGIKDNVQILCR